MLVIKRWGVHSGYHAHHTWQSTRWIMIPRLSENHIRITPKHRSKNYSFCEGSYHMKELLRLFSSKLIPQNELPITAA